MKASDSTLQSFSRRCSLLVSPGTDRNLDGSQMILPLIRYNRLKSSRQLPPCDFNKSYVGFSLCHLVWHVSCGSVVTWRIISACRGVSFFPFRYTEDMKWRSHQVHSGLWHCRAALLQHTRLMSNFQDFCQKYSEAICLLNKSHYLTTLHMKYLTHLTANSLPCIIQQESP